MVTMQTNTRGYVIAAIIVVVLQIIVAPFISIGFAVPNFILAFCLVVGILEPGFSAVIFAFILGLIYNLIAVGPLGAMAFALVLMVAVIAHFFSLIDNDSLLMPMVVIAVSSLLVEIIYALFVTMFSIDVSFVQAFVYRALPCTLYDAVLGIILYLIFRRLFKDKSATSAHGMLG